MVCSAKKEVGSEVVAWEVLLCISMHGPGWKEHMALPVVAVRTGTHYGLCGHGKRCIFSVMIHKVCVCISDVNLPHSGDMQIKCLSLVCQ